MSHIEDFQLSTFNFQRYEKKRFGEEVFPGKSDKSAVRKLHNWIMNCPDLVAALQTMGLPYAYTKDFTVGQVRLIMEYLGDP